MAKQTINIGAAANDHTGTPLRDAFDMVNDNFTELYNLHAAGYGVFAYLPAPEVQTMAEADTYQPITGTFTNDPANGFIGVGVPVPGIRYDGEQPLYFEIDAHAVYEGSAPGMLPSFAIAKNSEIIASSVMTGYAKTAEEPQCISGTCVVLLEKEDLITLMVKTVSGNAITINNFTTTIRPFSIMPE